VTNLIFLMECVKVKIAAEQYSPTGEGKGEFIDGKHKIRQKEN